MTVAIDIPGLELKSENWWRQEHLGWVIAKQKKREKEATRLHLLALVGRLAWQPPFVVTLTRFSMSTRGLDGDGLQGAFKLTRDVVADFLKVDDGDTARIGWVYAQKRGPFAVRIEIRTREATT